MKPKISKATQRNFAKFRIKGMMAQINDMLKEEILYPNETWALSNIFASLDILIKNWKPKTPKGRV